MTSPLTAKKILLRNSSCSRCSTAAATIACIRLPISGASTVPEDAAAILARQYNTGDSRARNPMMTRVSASSWTSAACRSAPSW
jgi:hypothetical protein